MLLRVALFLFGGLFSTMAFAADLGFHDESEVGAAIASGNSNSETYNEKFYA